MIDAPDTIVAIASPPGHAPRGLIRISGPDAWSVVTDLGIAPTETPLPRRRGLTRHRLASGVPCLLVLYPGPASYTGEDVIEIVTVGHPLVLNRIVESAIAQGTRHAEPGEFTMRAWLNGKLTLPQAEGIAATIAATSDAQLNAARTLMSGSFAASVHDIADRLTRLLALVEVGIDFTEEEDVIPIAPALLHEQLDDLRDRIDSILQSATGHEAITDLPLVALIGPTNAGKSTLFNALLGSERVVVSDVHGTTRDVIAEPMHLDPDNPESAEIMLIDLAGTDPSVQGLNPQMQLSALHAIERADLLVLLHPPQGRAELSVTLPKDTPCITVYSQADRSDSDPPRGALSVSAVTGEGLPALRDAIAQSLADKTTSLSADVLVLWPRHEAALRSALQAIRTVCANLREGEVANDQLHLNDPELIAADLRDALDALGGIVGTISTDDVLDHVFSTFCIGK